MAASKTLKNKKPTTSGITNPSYCVSTAVSDFVLMSSCVFGIWRMFLENWKNFNKVYLHGYIWFGFCGAAAALGVFRFGRKQLPSTMQKAHTLASWVAGTIGMANLAAQFYNHHFDLAFIGNIHLFTCALSLLAYFSRNDLAMTIAGQGVSAISTLSVLAGGLFIGKGNLFAAAGAGLVIAAAPFDRDAKLGPVPFVDIFHYILTTANILFLKGMVTDKWDLPTTEVVFSYFY